MDGKLVLVTGGAGLIGLHCILKLILDGYSVRTTLRSAVKENLVIDALVNALQDPDVITPQHIRDHDSAVQLVRSSLSFAIADLCNDEGWDEAVKDCRYILHVASPFPMLDPKDISDLTIPAVDGTIRVLRAASAARSASGEYPQRVVLTSTIGTIIYHENERENVGHPPYTEEDWSDEKAESIMYVKSKIRAERAAWDFIKDDQSGLELTTVHPSAVFGPPLVPREPSTTVDIVRQLLNGSMPATPPITIQCVDVRDVASLHVLAMLDSRAAGQRYLATESGGSVPMLQLAKWIREDESLAADYGNQAFAKLPNREIPAWLIRVLSYVLSPLRLVLPELGVDHTTTSIKAQTELGWQTRTGRESIIATARALLKANAL